MFDWRPPSELPDLRRVGVIAIDTETKDDRLRVGMGSGWPLRAGHICGVSVAYHEGSDIRAHYFPLRHPDSTNFDPAQIYQWLRDLIASDVRFVTQNGLYDFGWLRAEAEIKMPPGERLEEIGALATMVDENRFKYSLDALCSWRGLPGKDETLLHQGIEALGLVTNKRKKVAPQEHLWQLPAHYVGPYAEADAVNTLRLYEDLDPILDREGTRAAYRLECDILPMVQAMRLRGIRIDLDAAERARDLLLRMRNAALAEISEKLGSTISMTELRSPKWLAQTCDRFNIKYPRTEKGNPSFTGGKTGWMLKDAHWLPSLIGVAGKYDKAATDFAQKLIDHTVNGRIHAEIYPHRSEDNGTKSFRFSYSDPPLQQMPSRDPEITPLIRGMFLPEEGQVWAKPDASQQEFRLVVHYANQHKLPKAADAVARYRDDPDADFHALAAALTKLERTDAKNVNFAKIYGAGVKKFAEMIGRPLQEAQRIYAQYDRELPFLLRLSDIYCQRASTAGFITLYDGARRHFDRFAPGGKWQKHAGPCSLEEAQRRIKDPNHPWRGRLYRAETHTALNALIQGSAARHTKLWMLACWREGITPLLQMHDSLDCSVSSREQAEMVARLGEDAVKLDVPMRVDLKFGRNWGDATHTWAELHNGTPTKIIEEFHPATLSAHHDDEKANLMDDQQETPPWIDDNRVTLVPDQAPKPESATISAGTSWRGGDAEDDDYSSGEQPRGRDVAAYIYRDAGGQPYLKIARTSAEQFPQWHWEGGRWLKGKTAGPKIPYRLPELIAAAPDVPIFICEGEKDADNVAALGFIATTNSEGAGKGKWTVDLNKWFTGKQTVYICEDNDDDGRRHAREVASNLQHIVNEIRTVSFSELPPKGDVSDWLETGSTKEQLLARAKAAPRWQPDGYVLVRASDIVPRAMDWLWQGHILRGSQELLTGVPGGGKSQIDRAFAAYVTTGKAWPDGANGAPAGNVIMLTAEDCLDQTIVPRLIAAGADRERVFLLKKIRRDNKERMFLLGEDLEELERMIAKTGDVRLITIDPITAYMGSKLDSHRATDVRGQLGPLADLAERCDVSLSAITHPPKHTSQRSIDQFIGSQAFIAAARIGHMTVEEVDEDEDGNRVPTGRSLFTNAKNNVSRKMSTLAYRIGEKQFDGGISAAFITWEEIVDLTADEAIAAAMPGNKNKRSDAAIFLADILANGPVLVKLIDERATEHGLSKDQLKRAKQKLDLAAFKEQGKLDGPWFWALPQHAPKTESAEQ